LNPLNVTTTEAVDSVFVLIFSISAVMLLGIVVTIVIFLVKYNRKRHPHPTSQVESNMLLETVWTIIPTILVAAMFYYGWEGYLTLRNVPADAMQVTATGRMWSWAFEYENGRISDRLYVPVGRAVKVNIHSEDVLHSFFIPAFRVKRDAVPGMTTEVWFRPDQPGSYDIFCAEYCGREHASMITTVEALPEHEFNEWYRGEKEGKEEDKIQALLTKYGCLGCHSQDGSPSVGPTFKGLWGRSVEVTTGTTKRTLTVDADYLRRSILEPNTDVVVGYPAIMPSFDTMDSNDLEELIESFQRSSAASKAGQPGEAIFIRQGCIGCHSRDGSTNVGPTLKGILDRSVTVMRDGKETTLTSDDDYLKESIINPGKDVVKGFPAIMPPYDSLSEEELEQLVEYLKSLQ